MVKNILKILLALFLIINLFRPEKNKSSDLSLHISTTYEVPENVTGILKNACFDCHSNNTEYPWYSKIQPVAWWLDSHIQEGKDELNFSEFIRLPVAVQHHKFEEIIEVIDDNEMPLPSYTYFGLHQEAKLSQEEKKTLKLWAKSQMDHLKQVYPPDSLVMKRRRPAQNNE